MTLQQLLPPQSLHPVQALPFAVSESWHLLCNTTTIIGPATIPARMSVGDLPLVTAVWILTGCLRRPGATQHAP